MNLTARDLLGPGEVAELLGLSSSGACNLHTRGRLPEPFVQLRMGPVWLRRDIEAFQAERQAAREQRLTAAISKLLSQARR